MSGCVPVRDCVPQAVWGWAAANDRLLAYAREKGKKIEYHNLPLHKMQ